MITRTGIGRSAVWLAAVALLASCGTPVENADDVPPPSPALWELANADNEIEGWLFGTIHVLPDNVKWRTEQLDKVVSDADFLVVEVANLDNTQALLQTFAELALTANLPPLDARVPPEKRDALSALLDRGKYRPGDFTATESWAAALTLAQIARVGKAENGADRVLIREFSNRRVMELEGARRQLGIFDALPEQDQRDLLIAVIDEANPEGGDDTQLTDSWVQGDLEQLIAENSTGLLADPELRAALLINRNRDWADRIAHMADSEPAFLVAVGAAHMVGDEGLPALLDQRGISARRIQ